MAPERQFTQADAERAREQLERAMSSGERQANFKLGEADVVLERGEGPDGAFTLRVAEHGLTARVFPAVAEPSESYPASLPFIAGEAVTVTETGSTITLAWIGASDPDQLMERLHQACIASGWEGAVDPDPAPHQRYTRAGMERILIAGGPIVSLLEKPI